MIGHSPQDTGNEDAPAADSTIDSQPDPAPAMQPATPPGSQPICDKDQRPKEVGGREGPDPTRYGDWEKNGRCIDF